MYKLIHSQYDTTIYEQYPDTNAGTDEIIELIPLKTGQPTGQDDYYPSTFNSRILMKFDLSSLSTIDVHEAYLTLRATEVTEVPISYTLYSYPLSGSWINGTGYAHAQPEISNGVSWKYRTSKLSGTKWATGSYSANVTGSWATQPGGGTWYYNVSGSQSFNYERPDLRMNVTNIVRSWISGSIQNDGLIIKFSDTDEQSLDILGSQLFFSKDSHTIYIPRLEVYWDEQVLVGAGSFSSVTSDNVRLYLKNLKEVYTRSDKPIIRIGVGDMYPNQTYATSSNFLIKKRLPGNSYYEIQDVVTYEKIVPYNEVGTRVNCDSSGNYIKLDMSSLMPERYYKIVFKSEFDDESVIIIDNNYEFRVSNT